MRWWASSALAKAGFELAARAMAPPLELRDIAGPVEMPADPVWPYYAAAAAVAALLALGGAYFWRWRRTRRLAAEALEAARPRPPHDVALERLSALELQVPDSPVEYRAWCAAVAAAVRAFIGVRFGIQAAEATDLEFLEAFFRAARTPLPHQALLRDLFGAAVLAKFAGVPPAGEAALLVRSARRFVRETPEEAFALR